MSLTQSDVLSVGESDRRRFVLDFLRWTLMSYRGLISSRTEALLERITHDWSNLKRGDLQMDRGGLKTPLS